MEWERRCVKSGARRVEGGERGMMMKYSSGIRGRLVLPFIIRGCSFDFFVKFEYCLKLSKEDLL